MYVLFFVTLGWDTIAHLLVCLLPSFLRYLSHGQEWSKHLQISDKTSIKKFSLNPVWNEDFSMPVRRCSKQLFVFVVARPLLVKWAFGEKLRRTKS